MSDDQKREWDNMPGVDPDVKRWLIRLSLSVIALGGVLILTGLLREVLD